MWIYIYHDWNYWSGEYQVSSVNKIHTFYRYVYTEPSEYQNLPCILYVKLISKVFVKMLVMTNF